MPCGRPVMAQLPAGLRLEDQRRGDFPRVGEPRPVPLSVQRARSPSARGTRAFGAEGSDTAMPAPLLPGAAGPPPDAFLYPPPSANPPPPPRWPFPRGAGVPGGLAAGWARAADSAGPVPDVMYSASLLPSLARGIRPRAFFEAVLTAFGLLRRCWTRGAESFRERDCQSGYRSARWRIDARIDAVSRENRRSVASILQTLSLPFCVYSPDSFPPILLLCRRLLEPDRVAPSRIRKGGSLPFVLRIRSSSTHVFELRRTEGTLTRNR